MDVDGLRAQIPTTQHMTYMNTGWSGPSPTQVLDAIRTRLEHENINGPASPGVKESGDAISIQAREAVAALLKASPHEVLLTENTTEGLNLVLNGLPWKRGDEIITCDLEHASILLTAYRLQERRGVRTKVLSIATDEQHDGILSRLEDALTDRTRMVFLSHIEYSSGLRMPIEQIAELIRGRDIWLLVDGAQTAGHIPIDVRALGCDFYSISGQKWLLGPDGTGALYIKESMIPVVEPSRIAYKAVEDYDRLGSYEPRTDIDKFVGSTTSVPLRSGLVEAIRFIRDVGLEEIEERNLLLARSLKAGLAQVPGVKVLSPLEGPGSSGLVAFTIEGVDPEAAVSELWEANRIVIRHVTYPPSMRASLDFFNTEAEVGLLVESLREMNQQR